MCDCYGEFTIVVPFPEKYLEVTAHVLQESDEVRIPEFIFL